MSARRFGRRWVKSKDVLQYTFPTVCVGIRRLHDIGMSGWYYLVSFIPLVGAILMIVWGVRDSQPGSNQYGPNPKGIDGGMYY